MTDEEHLSTADMAAPQAQAETANDDTRAEAADRTEGADEQTLEPLLASEDTESFKGRWAGIQTGFVDSPRQAVEQADGLVAELMQRLAQTFSEERESLESQWSRGDDVSTEDLRVGLQRYRSFFDRLLST